MIEFMILGAPRSGTAWAATWLSSDRVHCIHDPLARWPKERLWEIESTKTLGVSCTALGLWPAFCNQQTARKVVLHRDPTEIQVSMARLGIDGRYDFESLDQIQGLHCHWRDLFEHPQRITDYLHLPFDRERHEELVRMNIQDTEVIRSIKARRVA